MFNSNIGPGYLPRHFFVSNKEKHCISWFTKPDLGAKLLKHISSSTNFSKNIELRGEIENYVKQDNYVSTFRLSGLATALYSSSVLFVRVLFAFTFESCR